MPVMKDEYKITLKRLPPELRQHGLEWQADCGEYQGRGVTRWSAVEFLCAVMDFEERAKHGK